jgi:hypothetical protein
MILNDQPSNHFTSPPASTDLAHQLELGINDALRGVGSPETRARLLETRTFMVAFARNLVTLRAPAPTPSTPA